MEATSSERDAHPPLDPPALRDLVDVAAVVPHRMGFQPRDCVVIVLVDAQGRWFATARHDMRSVLQLPALVAWVESIARRAARVLVGVYGREGDALSMLSASLTAVPTAGAGWCVTPDGELVIPGPRGVRRVGRDKVWGSASQLELLAAGSVPESVPGAHPLSERWDAPRLAAFEERLRCSAARSDAGVRALLAWAEVLDEGGTSGARDERLAAACAGLGDLKVRDAILPLAALGEYALAPGAEAEVEALLCGTREDRVDRRRLERLEQALEEAAPQLPQEWRVEALCLLAWCDWARGQGSRAAATLEGVLRVAPRHRLGTLLLRFIDQGRLPEWVFRYPS